MKTTLINPPQNTNYPQPPLGLASVAAILEKNHYPVEIIDANALKLSESEIINAVKDSDIIGITAMTSHINSAIYIAKKIKDNYTYIKMILGGPHVTILPEETLNKVPEIDIIIRGEGEETIADLYEAIEKGNKLENVYGITYREKGSIKTTPTRTPIMDLDTLPFPAYHLLPLEKYKQHPPHGIKSTFMAIMTSRGCPYNCIYCSKPIFGSKFRAQSPNRTVDEIEYLIEHFGIREFTFYDDSFTFDKKRIYLLCDEINRRNLDILWTCETRVNLISEELIQKMKNAGCYMIAYGIESGSQMILDNLRKGVTLNQVKEAINITHKTGINTVGYFMMGSPKETPQTLRDTIDFAKNLQLDFAQFSITIPFPGTDLYKFYIKNGEKVVNWDDFIYASLKSKNTPVFETESLNREELIKWNAKAYKEFYLRVPYIWKRFKSMRSFNDLKINFKGIYMFKDMVSK